jgi:chaperonin GroEL
MRSPIGPLVLTAAPGVNQQRRARQVRETESAAIPPLDACVVPMTEGTGRSVIFGDEARRAILRGAALLAEVAGRTLGPAGHTVLIDRRFAAPITSRSGYGIAKLIEVPDRLEDLGVQALREVAWRTIDAVGDGTTTAMILTRALLAEGVRAASSGMNPRALQRGIERAVVAVCEELEARSRPAPAPDQLARIAAHAAGGDREIGALLAEATARVGPEGVILVEGGKALACELEVRLGMHYDKGFVSPRFVTDEERMRVDLEDPYILMQQTRIADLDAIIPALNAFAKADRALLFIAEDVAGQALATLVVNKVRAGFKVAAAYAPGVGAWRLPMLEDVAITTGGLVVSDEFGNRLRDLRPEMLGRAKRVLITEHATTIIEGAGDPALIDLRCRELRVAIEREKHLSYDREQLQQRLARLTGGIAVIKVGGATSSAIGERKERATGAASAVRAAAAGGIVTGGGAALVHAGKVLRELARESLEQGAAIDAVGRAVLAPARRIAANAGADGRSVVARLLADDDPEFGFDAARRSFGNLHDAGVVDATRVVCATLRNAASTATRLLTSEAAVAPARGNVGR